MVKNLLSLLSTRQSSILTGASILMISVFAAKFLGLIKDRLLSHNFSSSETTIFFAAFRIPDILFNLLIFGTLSVAFIPLFTEYLHKKGENDGFKFASNILNISLLSYVVLAIICSVFIAPLNSIVAPGIIGQQKEITDYLTKIIFLGQALLILGTFFMGMAHSYQRFIIPALAPLFYNIGIILGIIFFSSTLHIVAPALGVVIGAALHVLIQLPFIISLGFRYKLSLDIFNSGVKELLHMMSFRNISLVVEHISETIAFALSTLISSSAPTLYTFAQHLYVVPIGLFGATIAQAALPVLSREKAQEDLISFKITLLTTIHQILFLTLPAAAMLIVLKIPIVRLAFGASQFNWEDTVLTGNTVAWFSVGLVAQSVSLILVRGFYALKDTRSPVIISVITVAINIVLSYLLVIILKKDVSSLGIAYAVAGNVSGISLLLLLGKKIGGFSFKNLFLPAFKMLVAALIAGMVLYIIIQSLDKLVFDTTRVVGLILLTGTACFFGLSIYLLIVWLLEVRELNTYVDLIKKFYKMQFKVKTEEIVKETGGI